ncbi:uncharacterized protein PpBr36_09965 [Pyricularia pennisetigena]|uniref:uncharacterized protein n=1 Tax=Pyricularia pennisetigena TaxID=1578925 RepID=UPI00114F8AC6|nr:uncharacterized protein PpBr36_09965 [Pyricularia pennisetigena]TLS22293.1 hypothetical protein PpBr36_09965 [Pyricularia pennisetigena]
MHCLWLNNRKTPRTQFALPFINPGSASSPAQLSPSSPSSSTPPRSTMSSSATSSAAVQPGTPSLDPALVADFQRHLTKSRNIVALIGAGLSASSGLATFRGPGGMWQNHDVFLLASPAGFVNDPGLVWQFYSYRREQALKAQPNKAHKALAELARKVPGFTMLTQNVDNLSPRAGHPDDQLLQLHGNLFDLKCWNESGCGYTEKGNTTVPLTPALDTALIRGPNDGVLDGSTRPRANPLMLAGLERINREILGEDYVSSEPTVNDVAPLGSTQGKGVPLGNTLQSKIDKKDLPQCPKCKSNLLRPGVVWFGEALPEDTINKAEALFEDEADPIDLCLVIGTSAQVWPAAGYVAEARNKGARVAVVNLYEDDVRKNVIAGRDWAFIGDAAEVIPLILKPVIGEV